MKFLILFIIFLICSAKYDSDFPCPTRSIEQNFDIKRISGKWYTVMKYEDAYGSSLTCGYGTYTLIDDYSVKVVDCEMLDGKYSCLTGIISVDEPNRVPLEGKTSYAEYENPSTKIDEFKYLSTDYDNYAIVYECKDNPGGKSTHFLWVSSRTPAMSESTKSVVNPILEEYFDKNEIKLIEQNSNVCDPRN